MYEEVAHDLARRAVEIQSGTPGRCVPIAEETLRIDMKKVSGGAEMIVDDVEQDHEFECVRALDQPFQIARLAVALIGAKRRTPS